MKKNAVFREMYNLAVDGKNVRSRPFMETKTRDLVVMYWEKRSNDKSVLNDVMYELFLRKNTHYENASKIFNDYIETINGELEDG